MFPDIGLFANMTGNPHPDVFPWEKYYYVGGGDNNEKKIV
jgi:hypothetical protein